MLTVTAARRTLSTYADEKRKAVNLSYFKTSKGEYGYGDQFIGVSVPHTRIVAKQFKDLPIPETIKLLKSKIHEERLLALIILNLKFFKADEGEQKQIFDLYLKNRKYINNWDLVDTSAPNIPGPFLFNRNRSVLYKLAKSKSLWDRRIAMLSTHYFIRQKDFFDTLKLAALLLKDKEDLMHKAVGWMLREIGEQDLKPLLKFLDKYHKTMPRTMLRYSIEKLTPAQRKKYMSKRV